MLGNLHLVNIYVADFNPVNLFGLKKYCSDERNRNKQSKQYKYNFPPHSYTKPPKIRRKVYHNDKKLSIRTN